MVYPAQTSQSTLGERFEFVLDLLGIKRAQFALPPHVSQQHISTWLGRGKFGEAAVARLRELSEVRGVADFTGDWLNLGSGPVPRRIRDISEEPPFGEQGSGARANPADYVPFQYLAGFSTEPSQFVDIPRVLVANLSELTAPSIRAFINPSDVLRGEIERGELVFVDSAVRTVKGDGIYVYKLGGIAQVRRFQIRGTGVLRLHGTHSYEDSIELSGPEVEKLEIGGRVVGKLVLAKM